MAIPNPPALLETGSPGDWTVYAAATANMAYINDTKFEILGEQVDEDPLLQPGEYLIFDFEDTPVYEVVSIFFDDVNTEIEVQEASLMAILNITEFRRLAEDARGRMVPVGEMPSQAVQSVSFTTSTNSAAFHKQTRFIRVLSDADAYIKVGEGTQAATVANGTKIEADVAEYFGIAAIKDMQLAVYDGSS